MRNKILTVSTAWGSRHGGANAFNYRLTKALADLGHEVTCLVKSTVDQDHDHAGKVRLVSMRADNTRKWEPADISLSYLDKFKEFLSFDLIIVHDLLSGEFINAILHSPETRPKLCAFIHTWYEETDYLSDLDDRARSEKKSKQLQLSKKCDYIFTSGSWLKQKFVEANPFEYQQKIQEFIPGRLEMELGNNHKDSIIAFGRLSLDDHDKKGAQHLFKAYHRLVDNITKNRDVTLNIPALVLQGTNLDTATVLRLKQELRDQLGHVPKIEFHEFEDYYEFDQSETFARLSKAKLVVTPSHIESFGLASLEAACLGIPLIAPRQSGFYHDLYNIVVDVPSDAISWLLPSDFDSKTIEVILADKMHRVLSHQEKTSEAAAQLASKIKEKWPTWVNSAKELIQKIERSSGSQLAAPGITQPAAAEPDSDIIGNKLAGAKLSEPPYIQHDATKKQPLMSERVRALLNKAVTPDGASEPFGAGKAFVDWYSKVCPIRELTLLQQDFERKALQEENSIFDRKFNIILCGPTSSGKTAISDFLIFQTVFANTGNNARAIYLSPTKALAHEKHVNLQKIFSEFNYTGYSSDNIVVSTGDDAQHDHKIIRCEFSVVSTVYEKANTLFSRNPSILSQVGLLIIDELHMFSDLERGPMLELLAAKAQSAGVRAKLGRVREEEESAVPKILGISTDEALIQSFIEPLTRTDEAGSYHPIIVANNGRPVTIRHVLHVPCDGGHRFEPIPLGSSADVGFPSLEAGRRSEVRDIAINAFNTWKAQTEERRKKKEPIPNIQDSVLNFIKSIISDHPTGRRILVFVPSRSQAEIFANSLSLIVLERRHSDGSKNVIPEGLVHVDDVDLRKELMRWAEQGIYVHHSDLPSNTLRSVEETCQRIVEDSERTEVLIATTTLSYGVNLAISDVIITQQQYFASDRFGEPRLVNLSHCEFHNMAGRGGRLGRLVGSESVAHILFAVSKRTNENNLFAFLENYYSQAKPFESKIYVDVDREAEKKIRLISANRGQPTLDLRELTQNELVHNVRKFSLPFIRTILDSVRHLNYETVRPEWQVEPSRVSSRELVDLFQFTPFGKKELRDHQGLARIEVTFEFILRALRQKDFRLVDNRDDDSYIITDRGDSILNTGKSISAIINYQAFIDLWNGIIRLIESNFDVDFNSKKQEVLNPYFMLLAVIAQRDVMTAGAEYTYEAGRESSTEISEASIPQILDDFANLVGNIAGIESQNRTIRRITSFFYSAMSGGRLPDASDFDIFDEYSRREYFDRYVKDFDRANSTTATFRLALFTLKWISGANSKEMETALLPRAVEGRGRKRFMGKPRFFEQISYGLSFVGTLVRTEYGAIKIGNARVALRLRKLAECVKLGFSPQSLPFSKLVSRTKTRQMAIAVYNKIPSSKAILSYRGGTSHVDSNFTMSDIYNVFSEYYKEEICNLSFIWAERGRIEEDPIMRNLAEMWSEFSNQFESLCLGHSGKEKELSLNKVIQCLFKGLNLKLDCAALGYGSGSTISEPIFESYGKYIKLTYADDDEDRESRREALIVFGRVGDTEIIDVAGDRIHTSDLAVLRPDCVWLVLVEPPLSDWSEARKDFAERLRKPERDIRFMAFDAFLIFISAIVRGFIDSPDVIDDDRDLDETIFLVEHTSNCFNKTIVGQLQAATLEYDTIWSME